MRAPTVVICAGPYESELCRRALVDIGLSIELVDDIEAALPEMVRRPPLVLVLGVIDLEETHQLIRKVRVIRQLPTFLLVDPHINPVEAERLGAARLFTRPINIEALADAVEKLAVEAEAAGQISTEDANVESAAHPTAAAEPNAFDAEWEITFDPITPLSPPISDAMIVTPPVPPPGRPFVGALLRVDEVLADGDGLPPFIAPRPRSAARRTTAAYSFDDEISQVERRLFPDAVPDVRRGLAEGMMEDAELDALTNQALPELTSPFVGQAAAALRPVAAPAAENPPGSTVSAVDGLPVGGNLARTDVAGLVAGICRAGWSGCLRLSQNDGQRLLFFEGGLLVSATSSLSDDRLAEMLFREGKLRREQLNKTREMTEHGARAADRLVQLGLLKAAEVFPTLRRHVEELFYSCFAWDAGEFELVGQTPAVEDKVRLNDHPWALIVEGIRRKYAFDRLVTLLGPAAELVLAPTRSLDQALESAGLTAKERAICQLFDGERSLEALRLQASTEMRLADGELYTLAFSLSTIGAVVRGGQPERASSVPSDLSIERERILAKQAQTEDGDYFRILGVDRYANTYEIERAFERLRTDFGADRFAESVRTELADSIFDIQLVLDEAHRVLINERLRAAYREHLIEP